VECLAELCAEERVPLMLDPAPAQELPSALLRRVRWFTPNETEAAFYAGRSMSGADLDSHSMDDSAALAVRDTVRSLLAQGPAGVIMKLGPRGVYLATEGVERHVAAMAVEAIDTTAAGDALNGAFAVGLMLGKSAVDSASFAVAAASISVTRAGAQPSMPTLAEVSRMCEENG
jgi:ribokinase